MLPLPCHGDSSDRPHPLCRCDICPLAKDREGHPVPGAAGGQSPAAHGPVWILGEAPGRYEISRGAPFMGPSGAFLDAALDRYGSDRRQWNATNVVLCKPPESAGSFRDYLQDIARRNQEITRQNRIRKAAGAPPLPLIADPRECCRGRLLDEIQGAYGVLALGSQAVRALTGTGAILRWRGSPLRIPVPAAGAPGAPPPRPTPPAEDAEARRPGEAWVVPSLHPAFALRGGSSRGSGLGQGTPGGKQHGKAESGADAFADVIRLDIGKAVRIFRDDHTTWDESGCLGPIRDITRLEWLLDDAGGGPGGGPGAAPGAAPPVVALDVETTGGHVLETTLICVGLAWRRPDGIDAACVLPIREPGSLIRSWSATDEGRLRAALVRLLSRATIVAHNGIYDSQVLRSWGIPVDEGRWEDTMLGHHAVVSDHPHNLGFVGTIYTDARYWKDDVREGGRINPAKVDPARFFRYNERDCLATLRCFPKIQADLVADDQTQIYRQSKRLAVISRQMTEWGMRVDLEEAGRVSVRLRARAARCVEGMQALLDQTDFRRRIEEIAETASGVQRKRYESEIETFRPSSQRGLQAAIRALDLPITVRTRTGLISTAKQVLTQAAPYATPEGRLFIRLLTNRPGGKDANLDDFGWRPAEKVRSTYVDRIPVLTDGRLHAHFLVTGTVTGRFAHRDPNVGNWPKWIRRIIVPDPGHIFVGADYSQLEWRISAHLSNDPALLDVFRSGMDPHRWAAAMVFGKPAEEITSVERDYWKRFLYALSYGGTWETVYKNLSAEFPEIRPGEIQAVYRRIKAAFPIWMNWRNKITQIGQSQGFLTSPILGRRRYFRGGKATEIQNYPIQSGAADIINAASIRIWEIVRADMPAWRMINQIHDALLWEVPEEEGDACVAFLSREMPGPWRLTGVKAPVSFPIDVKVGRTWAEV